MRKNEPPAGAAADAAAAARAAMLAQLAAEREKRRTTAATGAAPDDSQRKQERDALIERLLEERKERKGREQQPPPPRTAWETTQDRNERRLEHELRVGACAPSGRDAAAAASDAGDDASLSGLPPPHYPEEYIDGGRVVPDSDLDDAGMADFYMQSEGAALAFDGSDLALDEDVSLAEVVARADAAMAATKRISIAWLKKALVLFDRCVPYLLLPVGTPAVFAGI